MKKLDVMYSSKSDEWSTPQNFFDEINKEFSFDLDAAANSLNHKCDRYFTQEQNGLAQNWGGVSSIL
jgi:site-specific DNA-methyltransferase (adenine-specific)